MNNDGTVNRTMLPKRTLTQTGGGKQSQV